MHRVPGCIINNRIFESPNSLVYRGIREADKLPVILKILKEDYPASNELVRYRQEYEITHKFDIPGVIKAYGLEKYGNTLAIILEDFGGESLAIQTKKRKFNLDETLRIGIRLARILGDVHNANVIHKDINPSNIVFNSVTDELKLIDFGISSELSREIPELRNPERLEGTLAYMSPEQTGRMNRPLDYRTDFYALGVTLYELLSGHLPFDTSDPLELTHCHLAREPAAPHELNAEISNNLSSVLFKLLAKPAEERYQTTKGLIHDLQYCLGERKYHSSQERNKRDFITGKQDISTRFQLPQKLYGREKELETLLYAAERAAENHSEVLFIAGYSGVGKSALVKELYGSLIRPGARRGYFITGKFDQYHRDIPYSAVQDAFRDLTRQLLTESEEQLSLWKEKILTALGPNGSIMSQFLPELELLIGETPLTPVLDPAANRNRFVLVLRNFVRVFLTSKHPLVLFLDDLQWADLASLDLIKLITKDTRHLLLIGAYRNNEVGPAHPLLMTANEIQQTETPLHTIHLAPLGLADVQSYVADATRRKVVETTALAELIKHKTDGNPFALGEFLNTMQRSELLTFDAPSASWTWDLKVIQEQNISENVVELITDRISELDINTKLVLSRAACLGNTFDLTTLALIHETSLAETAGDLWPALEMNMLLPLHVEYRIAGLTPLKTQEPATQNQIMYRFAHDRIAEAAYNLNPEPEKQALHLKAGRLLLDNTSGTEPGDRLFTIVDHLNMGRKLLPNQAKRDELAELNHRAGLRARASTAYGAALVYFKYGLELLGEKQDSPWQKAYNLMLGLSTGAAEAAMLSSNYAEMEHFTEAVLKRAANILDGAKIYEIRIQAFMARNDLPAAVQTALLALKKLGINLPQKPGKLRVISELLLTKLGLSGKSSQDIISLPHMVNPNAMAASRILEKTIAAAYFSAPELLPLIIFRQIRLSLRYGNSSETPTLYGIYGVILAGVVGDVESGYNFGRLSLQMMEHLDVIESRAKVTHDFNYLLQHWKEPLKNSIQPALEIHKIGLETGDLEFASYSLNAAVDCSFCSGKELSELEKDTITWTATVTKLGHKTTLIILHIFIQTIRQLRKYHNPPSILIGDAYDEKEMVPIQHKTDNKTALFFVYLGKLILSYLFQESPEITVSYADEGDKYQESVLGLPGLAVFNFYDCLTRLSRWASASKSERKRLLKKVQANRKKIKKWADYAPMNQLHRYYLVTAEEARIGGKTREAHGLYEKAIEQARENDYRQDEALAWELAGRFHLDNGLVDYAHFCLMNARYAYSRWGADAKVAQMENSYPEIFSLNTTVGENTISVTTTLKSASGMLDLATIVKASQAIAGEIRIEGLIQKLMSTVLENTGAEEGFLIIARGERYLIKAHARLQEQLQVKLLNAPLFEAEQDGLPMLPQSLVAYVIRTKEPRLLDDALTDELFRDDPYIRERRPHSILCAPIIYQQGLSGLIYLENNGIPGAFTAERLEILRLLSAQIAVSLKNALDYEELQHANRTKNLFLSKMSHQLRTPLNSILGQGQNLLANKSLDQIGLKQVGDIIASGEKLSTFISNVLELTRLEKRGPEFETNFNPDELFDTLLTPFRARAENLGLSFKTQPPPQGASLPREVRADRGRVKQILENLLDNAVKFTKTGGITVCASYDGQSLRFEIEDTGPGLTPAQQERIFSPFQDPQQNEKGAETRLETTEGDELTGLGLAVSKILIDQIGGRLDLHSEAGRGSVLILEFLARAIIPAQATPAGNSHKMSENNSSPVNNPENSQTQTNLDKLIGPPPERAAELFQLAKSGDIGGVLDLVNELKDNDPNLVPFAEEVGRMARHFEERNLAEFVETYL